MGSSNDRWVGKRRKLSENFCENGRRHFTL